jgi:hypothetical protein
VAAVFATALVGAAQPAQAAAQTECNQTYTNTTLKGGVIVKAGDVCKLNQVRITGNLRITGGMFSVQNSLIQGGWRITGGSALGTTHPTTGDLCGNTVDGELRVDHTRHAVFIFGETDRHCAGGLINGGVRFDDNRNVGILEVDGYDIHGHVVDVDNDGVWNELEGLTVHGSAVCKDNNYVHGGTSAINDEGGPNTYTGNNKGCPA